MILAIHEQNGASVRQICAALQLPRSSFYSSARPTPTQLRDQDLGDLIERIFREHCQRYGQRRVWRELQARGVVCAQARVRRLMEERGLRAHAPRKFVPTTSDGRADQPSPNLVIDQPDPTRPDQVWAGDITFIPTTTGWLYLAVVIDLYSRKIVGWSLSNHMRSTLVVDALQQALGSRTATAIFHSDRGSQYGSGPFRRILQKANIAQSMSARANPYHNATTESFMATLKKEMLRNGCFDSEADARTEIFQFIESYYNRQRRHSSLNYLSPSQFEDQVALLK